MTSPTSSWLVIQKYLTAMCSVLIILGFYLFLSNWITLVLSCLIATLDPKGFNREFKLIDLTCDSKKFFIHMTNSIVSLTLTRSASVELFVLIFCFDNKYNKLPCSNVRHAPVWLLQSGCTANDASMFQVSVSLLSESTTSERWTVSSK